MGIAVLLVPGQDDVPLTAATLDRLGALGVTSVALVRDEQTVGLVLEGWAFDPVRSAPAALAAVSAGAAARTLYPVVQMAVSAAPNAGGN